MKNNLSDRVWKTRKARIQAEKRLNANAAISQLLIVVYSFSLVVASLWNFAYPSSSLAPIYFIIGSLFLLVLSIFLGAQHYTERALAMRNCYIKLDKLYWKMKRADEDSSASLIEDFETDYADTLLVVENHTNFDYLSFRYAVRKDEQAILPKLTFVEKVSYIFQRSWRLIFWFILLILPAIIFALLAKGALYNVGV